jgi:hypothetical protein
MNPNPRADDRREGKLRREERRRDDGEKKSLRSQQRTGVL